MNQINEIVPENHDLGYSVLCGGTDGACFAYCGAFVTLGTYTFEPLTLMLPFHYQKNIISEKHTLNDDISSFSFKVRC